REISSQIGNIRNQAESAIQTIFNDIDRAVADFNTVAPADDDLQSAFEALRQALLTELNSTVPNLANAQNDYRALLNFVYTRNRSTIDNWARTGLHTDYVGAGITSVNQEVKDLILNTLADTFAALNG